MKRIFTAIEISEAARRRVSDYIEMLRRAFPKVRAGWDKPEKLHLTLKFLGETSDSQLDELISISSEAARRFSPFKLTIAGTGVFPNERRPRVMWLGVIDEGRNLSKINRIFETECEKIGFPPEKRNYKPHLTVARLKDPSNSSELAGKHLAEKFEPVEFEVSRIVIYESALLPHGSVYQIVDSFDLNSTG
jgi:2'-5' RNA ligase